MGPPRDLAIRPLGLGEIIDRSVALTLRHFRTLFAAMLVIEAPALALGRLQQARAGEVLALLGDPARATAAFPSLTGFFGALLLSLLVLQLAATAAAAAIVAPSLDPAAPPGPSGLRRALAVVTATIVQVAALVLAPAFGALPGLLLAARAETFATQVVAIVAAARSGRRSARRGSWRPRAAAGSSTGPRCARRSFSLRSSCSPSPRTASRGSRASSPPGSPAARVRSGSSGRRSRCRSRSEERRVGKECRSRWSPY